jgi:hypothetical protein
MPTSASRLASRDAELGCGLEPVARSSRSAVVVPQRSISSRRDRIAAVSSSTVGRPRRRTDRDDAAPDAAIAWYETPAERCTISSSRSPRRPKWVCASTKPGNTRTDRVHRLRGPLATRASISMSATHPDETAVGRGQGRTRNEVRGRGAANRPGHRPSERREEPDVADREVGRDHACRSVRPGGARRASASPSLTPAHHHELAAARAPRAITTAEGNPSRLPGAGRGLVRGTFDGGAVRRTTSAPSRTPQTSSREDRGCTLTARPRRRLARRGRGSRPAASGPFFTPAEEAQVVLSSASSWRSKRWVRRLMRARTSVRMRGRWGAQVAGSSRSTSWARDWAARRGGRLQLGLAHDALRLLARVVANVLGELLGGEQGVLQDASRAPGAPRAAP